MSRNPSVIQISPGAGKDMSSFALGGGALDRQTAIVGDADKAGESTLLELPAHGTNDRGGSVKIGGRASASPFSPVAEGSRIDAWFTLNGQLGTTNVVQPTAVYDTGRRPLSQLFVTYNPLSVATIVPGAAGVRTKVMGITATINGAGPGLLSVTDGTNTLLVVDNFTAIGTRRLGYGPHMICQTPVNTGLVVSFSGTPIAFNISLLYYQAP